MIELQKDKYKSVNSRPDVLALRQKILDAFADLQFIEETHQYFLHGMPLESVSHVCHRYKPQFDAKQKAHSCFEKYFGDPESKYFQMTEEQILKQWEHINKKATTKGHTNHSFGEDCAYLLMEQYHLISRELVNGNLIPQDREEEEIIRFYNDIPESVIPILTETRVYDEEKGYAGTFDNLFAFDSKTSSLEENLIITDFKTNANLFKTFNNQKMLPPFDFLSDCAYSSYIIQLSLYQRCLEKIGLTVRGLRLIWLRTDADIMDDNGCDFIDKYRKWEIGNVKKTLDACL
jgi:hypothetical protein